MGGNLRYHTSGSAPIAKEVFETLKVAFAVDSVEVRPSFPLLPPLSWDRT